MSAVDILRATDISKSFAEVRALKGWRWRRGRAASRRRCPHAWRLGEVKIDGDNILLGEPFTFTKENIEQFDF